MTRVVHFKARKKMQIQLHEATRKQQSLIILALVYTELNAAICLLCIQLLHISFLPNKVVY